MKTPCYLANFINDKGIEIVELCRYLKFNWDIVWFL